MATTTEQHINARSDNELMQRLIAKAEMLGVDNPSGFIMNNMSKFVTEKVDGEQTIADVHAYADSTRRQYIAATPPLPGANLGAVTDAHLETAILAVQAEVAPPETSA